MKNKIIITIILCAALSILLVNNVSADINSNDIKDVFDYLNQTGSSIPIKVTTTASTNWTQFFISLVLSSFFLMFFFGQLISEKIENTSVKSFLNCMKQKTGRPTMLIKHTSQGMFSASMIDQSTLNKVSKALTEFKGKDFDLILHTPGGEVFSALFISRLFKNYPGSIRTLIPSYAMSGGTLLALSTDEIYMADSACLGPVDPQLGSLFKYGSARSWNQIVKFKGKRAEDSSIGLAMTGSQYTKSIRDHLTNTIDFDLSKKQKEKLAAFLTSGNVEHAYPLTGDQLVKWGIPIKRMKNRKWIMKMFKIFEKLSGEGVTYVK